MDVAQIFDRIESEDFRTHVNLASDYGLFANLVRQSDEGRALLDALDSPQSRAAVLARIRQLARSEVDERYESPWDAALATYVMTMLRKHSTLGQLAAIAARRARQTWWLKHTLRRISTVLPSPVAITAKDSCGPEPIATGQKVTFVTPPDTLVAVDPFIQFEIVALVEPYTERRTVESKPLDMPHTRGSSVEPAYA